MEDILASIRRILSEEDLPADPQAEAPDDAASKETDQSDVLLLDSSMLVAEATPDPELEKLKSARPPVVARSPMPPAPPVTLPDAAGVTENNAPPGLVPPAVRSEPPPSTIEPPLPASHPDMEPRHESPASAEAKTEIAGETGNPALPGRLPAAPILVPVPLSGQNPPPPLIKRPAELAKETVFTTPPPPASEVAPLPPLSAPPPASTFAPPPPVAAHDPVDNPPPPPVDTQHANQSPLAESRPAEPEPESPLTESSPMSASMSLSSGLASPETANAAASSVTNLVRALTSDRSAQIHSGGPTVADLVREELRPMVKAWLDSNLPPLVERLVRAEIERVISRASV